MKRPALAFSVLLLLIVPAWASFIRFEPTLTLTVEGALLKTTVSAVNHGDEPAFNVRAELLATGKSIFLSKQDEVRRGTEYDAGTSIDLSALKPGKYPLILRLHYTDANQYPFSCLAGRTFLYRSKNMPDPVVGKIKTATFWARGNVELRLKNLSDSELELSTSLVTPKELAASQEKIKCAIPARGEKSVVFTVSNFAALGVSGYQVYAIAEYKDQAILIPGKINIVEEKDFLGISYPFLVFILIVLALIFIGFQIGLLPRGKNK